MTVRTLLAGIAMVAVAAGPVGAAPQDVANDISAQIMSPYCPGVTLHDCPSDSATALRTRIADMAADGMTRSEIMAELVDEFGPTIRAAPATTGTGLLAWILPAVAILVGAMTAWWLARRWAASESASGPASAEMLTPAERRVIDAELDQLRGET
jgi:cytochrome c-type biogenesis protein CcmH